jgi:hypothetical protein
LSFFTEFSDVWKYIFKMLTQFHYQAFSIFLLKLTSGPTLVKGYMTMGAQEDCSDVWAGLLQLLRTKCGDLFPAP